MKLIPFRGKTPQIADDAFIAPGAVLIGDVHIASGVSVWYNAVIRADHEPIYIGANSNIQDGAVLHIDHGTPVRIGENVTIGHAAVVHSATIDDGALIGMNATVLNGAHIGAGSVVGANALVTENAEYEPDSLILGVPARAVGQVKPEMRAWIVKNCDEYVRLGAEYAAATTKPDIHD
jgi:carbonic anhydrase/acetyltransferase-like protein (isoleucine patch superfamily)